MATLWATMWKMYHRIRDTGHAGADEHAGLSAQVAWFAHHREKLRLDVTGAADAPNTELGVQGEMSRLWQERWRELSEEEKGEWEALQAPGGTPQQQHAKHRRRAMWLELVSHAFNFLVLDFTH